MNKVCRFLFSLLVLPLFALPSARALDFKLDPPRRLPNGAVDLSLRGTSGTNYTIDASVNLSSWFFLSSGSPTNGVLSLRHDLASNYTSLFYRGRIAADALPPVKVAPALDTNTALSGIVSLSGGSAVLFGATGTRYTLLLPTNSMPDAKVFTMTEVTNFSALPFAAGTIGAVRIEPADLVLWGAASLEITFRTNIDRRRIASFSSRGDGSGFQLMFDRVGTNRIIIPISRAGIYGSSVVTTQEIANMAGRTIEAAPLAKAASGGITMASGGECQAAKKAAARAIEQQISQRMAVRAQAAAARLSTERQNQLAGASDDTSSALSDVVDDMCNFYETEISPHWPAGASNCALGKVLTQFTLGIARQRQLLGADDDDSCATLSAIPFCLMFENCLNEIRECCAAGNRGSVKVAEVLSLQRQDALLGLDCITQAEAQEVIDECSSNVWTGSFSLQVSGHTNQTVTSRTTTSIQIDSYESTFEGSVIESTESGIAATGYIIQLRVFGQLSITDFHSQSTETAGPCSSLYHLQSDEVVAATNTEYAVSISTQPDGSYVLFEFNRTPTTFGVGANETEIDLRVTHSCEGGESTVNHTVRSQTGALGQALPLYQGRQSDPNVISGSQTAADPGSIPAINLRAQWDFSRRKKE